jgi:hypothetical protein
VRSRKFPQSRFDELKTRVPELRRELLAYGIPAELLEPTPSGQVKAPAPEKPAKTSATLAEKQVPVAV